MHNIIPQFRYYFAHYWHLALFAVVSLTAIHQMQTTNKITANLLSEKNVSATLAISKPRFHHTTYKEISSIDYESSFGLTDKTSFSHNNLSAWFKINFDKIPENLTIDFSQYETVIGFNEKGQHFNLHTAESENNTPRHRRHVFFDLLKSDTARVYYFKVFARKQLASDSLQIRLEDTKVFYNRLYQEFYENQHIAFWFLFVLGIGLFQLLYVGSLVWSRRKPEYFNYWLFAFFGIIYLYVARRFELGEIGAILPMWATSSIIVYMAIFNIFYCRFVRFYLESKQLYPFLDKQYRMSEWFMGAGVVLNFLIYLFTFDLEYTFSFFIPFTNLILVLDLYMLLLLYRIKSPLVHYLMLGAAFFVLTTVLGFSYKYFYSLGWVRQLEDFNAYGGILGSVLDAICLNLGLNYKHRLEVIAQQKAVETMRNTIASDLHDDLGSGLSTIRLLGERAQIGIENLDKKQLIQKMTYEASQLIEKMSTVIWAINSRNDTVESLIVYLRVYALDYFELSDLDCQFTLPDIPPSVSEVILIGNTRRHLFLSFKEALHNVTKHAQATFVDISIQLTTHILAIKISDNGNGMKTKNPIGNGLKNMKERMISIGGTFSVESEENKGTTIILSIIINKS